MTKPRVFIGSSVEGLPVAESLQVGMDFDVESTIWSQGVFGLSEGTLESLVRAVKEFDFAVLVLTPDDLVQKRDTTRNSARDNVLFELGLFMGALGRERTFIVRCRDTPMDLPTDLAGVTMAAFSQRNDGNIQAAVGPTCTILKRAIHQTQTNLSAAMKPQVAEHESVAFLKKELSSQAAVIRQILEAVTSVQKINEQSTGKQPQKRGRELGFLCGSWKDTKTDSVAWVRTVGDDLHLVYASEEALDTPIGCCLNLVLIGQSLFGRFKWFDGSFEGYAYLNIVSNDLMEGGWWTSDDTPEQAILLINKLKGENASQWVRQDNASNEPAWVEEYFQSLKKPAVR